MPSSRSSRRGKAISYNQRRRRSKDTVANPELKVLGTSAPQRWEGFAKFPGKCWFCGDAFPEGTPIRFVQRETVHEDPCFAAALASQ